MHPHTLQAALQQQINDDASRKLACSIFSTSDVSTISNLLNRYCQEQFGHDISTCAFAYLSVGATFVVQLTHGRELVLKANGPQTDFAGLTASCTVQQSLAKQGFPCPEVLCPPQLLGGFSLRNFSLMAQTFCDPGERVNPLDPNINYGMARYLAKLIHHTKSLSQPGLSPWMDLHQVELWHKPHNVLFDFEKTRAGAEWIDEIARRAKQILRTATGPLVIGHTDWSLQNMSFHQGKSGQQTLSCVYDWDSLRVGLEPCFVGGAARCFRHDWRYGPPKTAISVAEVRMFIQAYEQERGQPFSTAERQVLGAAVVYTAAYGVRCVHAIATPEDKYGHQAKHQLKQFVEAFLK